VLRAALALALTLATAANAAQSLEAPAELAPQPQLVQLDAQQRAPLDALCDELEAAAAKTRVRGSPPKSSTRIGGRAPSTAERVCEIFVVEGELVVVAGKYAFAAFDPINRWDPFGLANRSLTPSEALQKFVLREMSPDDIVSRVWPDDIDHPLVWPAKLFSGKLWSKTKDELAGAKAVNRQAADKAMIALTIVAAIMGAGASGQPGAPSALVAVGERGVVAATPGVGFRPPPMLNVFSSNSDEPKNKDSPKAPERTPHAKQRGEEGRPTGPAINDVQRARPADVFVQKEQGRIVVRGDKGREHIFEASGEHVTSFTRPDRAHQGRLESGDIRPATETEFQTFVSKFK
jgi:hypothetical protein